MGHRSLRGIVTVALLASAIAHAENVTSVVDIVASPGVTQRILYVRPETPPTAIIVGLPGGDGYLGITDEGLITGDNGRCSLFGRTAQRPSELRADGFLVVASPCVVHGGAGHGHGAGKNRGARSIAIHVVR